MERPRVGRFAALMERWRQSQGLSNPEFATRLGRSESGWSLVQNGNRRVSLDLAAAVLATTEEPWHSAFERALAEDLTELGAAGTPTDG